jgi:hypothetical protein
MRRVRVTTVTVERNKYYILRKCVCILALVIQHANRIFCASHYVAICGLSGSTILLHILVNIIFRKNLLRIKCVLIFSTAF